MMETDDKSIFRLSNKVQIKLLKSWVKKYLPNNSVLRQLILSRADEMDSIEYSSAILDWLLLLNIETKQGIE